MSFLRITSIKYGFLLGDHDSACTCKKPSLHEMELATHQHRWPEMRKIQKDAFNSYMDFVTEYEIDILRLFKLPEIDDIRKASLGVPIDSDGTFSINDGQIKQYKRLINNWAVDILGKKLFDKAKIKEVDDLEGTYPFYEAMAFNLTAQKTLENALRTAPDWMDKDKLRALIQLASTQDEYYNGVLTEGGTRIKTQLALNHLKEVIAALKEMAKTGTNPLEVGRWLHKHIGEGASWYWNRLARSESVLASNAAFFSNAEKFKVPYQEWSASSTACEICAAFDGKTWRIGQGPEPVLSTHPHCMCSLNTIYVTEDNIQSPWTRATPYDKPYTREERELLESLFA